MYSTIGSGMANEIVLAMVLVPAVAWGNNGKKDNCCQSGDEA
jgi:hypothetical protein